MSGIFISYRREDSAPYAGRLYDRLSARFGADRVFMDVDDIPPGADFAVHIGAKVASCDAMVVVIGNKWLSVRDNRDQLRLSDPNDYVALEISLALQRGIPVIPALVGAATMPGAAVLPESLRGLAQRNALSLRDDEFRRDSDKLAAVLADIPGLRRIAQEREGNHQTVLQHRKRALLWKAPLVLALVVFAVWWQGRQNRQSHPDDSALSAQGAKVAQSLAGHWSANVTYGWGATHAENFFFQPEGERIYGTASFLAAKRGIDDGKIIGDEITFSVRFQETSSQGNRDRKNYYGGKITGNEIRFRLQDDRGSPPLEFTATKSGQPG